MWHKQSTANIDISIRHPLAKEQIGWKGRGKVKNNIVAMLILFDESTSLYNIHVFHIMCLNQRQGGIECLNFNQILSRSKFRWVLGEFSY